MACYRIKRFGWLPDPLDHRDLKLGAAKVQKALRATQARSKKGMLATSPKRLPRKVDLRKACSPVEDQGNIGSCTAQSVVGLLEFLWKKTSGRPIDASRLFLYKVTRNLLGWSGDTGAFVRSTIKAARLFGVCPEDYWAYDEETFDDEPPAFCYSFAQNYKALVYYRLDPSLPALRKSLAQGVPFAFGFTCFESIDDETVEASGEIPYPGPDEADVGGHAVTAVGYDDKEKHLIIRNSWGRDWGDKGYGYLPYKYFENELAEDCWCLIRSEYEELGD